MVDQAGTQPALLGGSPFALPPLARDAGNAPTLGGTQRHMNELKSRPPPTTIAPAMVESWLNPLLVIDGRFRFLHGSDDVAAARDFVGTVKAPDERSLARAVVMRVHERMRILPTAFGVGMPKTLSAIIAARGGNCVSHAVLTTVVLRDCGLPTRLVSENVYTNFSLLRVATVFVRAPIGPTLNGHVWLETFVDGEWVPADAELGIFGLSEWLTMRVIRGSTVPWGIGVPVREHWRFPLYIRRLGADGMPEEDVTALYLVDEMSSYLRPGGSLPSAWVEGVQYFSRSFPWDGRAGLRILREWRRLRAMSRAVSSFAAGLSG